MQEPTKLLAWQSSKSGQDPIRNSVGGLCNSNQSLNHVYRADNT